MSHRTSEAPDFLCAQLDGHYPPQGALADSRPWALGCNPFRVRIVRTSAPTVVLAAGQGGGVELAGGQGGGPFGGRSEPGVQAAGGRQRPTLWRAD